MSSFEMIVQRFKIEINQNTKKKTYIMSPRKSSDTSSTYTQKKVPDFTETL